jgi:hypothetical protein
MMWPEKRVAYLVDVVTWLADCRSLRAPLMKIYAAREVSSLAGHLICASVDDSKGRINWAPRDTHSALFRGMR